MAGYDPKQPRDKKGRWTKGGATAVAGTAAAVALAGPMGGTTGVVSSGASGMSMQSGMSQVVRQALPKAKKVARQGRPAKAWQRLKLRRRDREWDRLVECGPHSYGDVQRFLWRNPCRSLDRVLFTLEDDDGNRIAVSVSWVRMPTSGKAARLRKLADVHGTGNITPLPGVVAGAGEVDWTGHNYDSRRTGRMTVIAEVEPVDGRPDHDYMDGIADIAAEFPRPAR